MTIRSAKFECRNWNRHVPSEKHEGIPPRIFKTVIAASHPEFSTMRKQVDNLHRIGRTARMGAKGKVTSSITKGDVLLANRIEGAMKKNESLESLNIDSVVRRDIARPRIIQQQ